MPDAIPPPEDDSKSKTVKKIEEKDPRSNDVTLVTEEDLAVEEEHEMEQSSHEEYEKQSEYVGQGINESNRTYKKTRERTRAAFEYAQQREKEYRRSKIHEATVNEHETINRSEFKAEGRYAARSKIRNRQYAQRLRRTLSMLQQIRSRRLQSMTRQQSRNMTGRIATALSPALHTKNRIAQTGAVLSKALARTSSEVREKTREAVRQDGRTNISLTAAMPLTAAATKMTAALSQQQSLTSEASKQVASQAQSHGGAGHAPGIPARAAGGTTFSQSPSLFSIAKAIIQTAKNVAQTAITTATNIAANSITVSFDKAVTPQQQSPNQPQQPTNQSLQLAIRSPDATQNMATTQQQLVTGFQISTPTVMIRAVYITNADTAAQQKTTFSPETVLSSPNVNQSTRGQEGGGITH